MRNFIKTGDNINVTFPYAVAGGGGVLIGAALFGIAVSDTAQGDTKPIVTVGLFSIAKAPGAMIPGAKLYWDDAAKALTTDATGGKPYVANATRPAAAGDTIVHARLNGVAI